MNFVEDSELIFNLINHSLNQFFYLLLAFVFARTEASAAQSLLAQPDFLFWEISHATHIAMMAIN